jgi:hypothetical protein
MYCSILITVSQAEDSNLHIAGVAGMYCSNLITVSQEGHSKLHRSEWNSTTLTPLHM